jgi:hypothetical protein
MLPSPASCIRDCCRCCCCRASDAFHGDEARKEALLQSNKRSRCAPDAPDASKCVAGPLAALLPRPPASATRLVKHRQHTTAAHRYSTPSRVCFDGTCMCATAHSGAVMGAWALVKASLLLGSLQEWESRSSVVPEAPLSSGSLPTSCRGRTRGPVVKEAACMLPSRQESMLEWCRRGVHPQRALLHAVQHPHAAGSARNGSRSAETRAASSKRPRCEGHAAAIVRRH